MPRSGSPPGRSRFPSLLRLLCAAAVFGALAAACPALAAEKKPEVSADQREFVKARDEQRAEMNKFFEKYEKTPEAAREKLQWPDPKPYVARMWAIVRHDPAAPVAAAALTWLASTGHETSGEVLETIRQHHLKSDQIASLCFYLARMPGGLELLRQIAKENPHPGVQALALYTLGEHLQGSAPLEAEQLFTDLAARFPDEKIGDQKAGQLAKSALFAMRNLGIGKTAPEIEGEDVDGKKFKLSDFRGKVVVIDFWGDW